MLISAIHFISHQYMATLTVLEFCYRPPQNQEAEETNKILSLAVTKDVEALPEYTSNKLHPINQHFLYDCKLLHLVLPIPYKKTLSCSLRRTLI